MKYCLIGEKLAHSYSAELHGAMGLDYSLVELAPNELSNFLRRNDYAGFNVTIPYKKAVIPHLDCLDETARLTGAVNTVKRDGDKLVGFNTDLGGMSYMIESKGVSLQGKNVLILGSGGTSATAQALAKLKGAKSVNVVSRSGELNYTNCYELTDTEVIINTTPVGMYPNICDKPLIELARFNNLTAVFDCIYNPFFTELLLDARAQKLVCSDGLPMLVRQAVLAENVWKDEWDDQALTQTLITAMRKKMANVVLFGMPSSGKTTLGKLFAEQSGKQFVDLDEYITEKHGLAPSDIIREHGEQYFRKLESAAVDEIALSTGKVISLGGGTVLDPANVSKLKKNGVFVYVKRDLRLLTTDNRPLSQAHGVETLFNKRQAIYNKVKDAEIQNNSDVISAVKEIEKAYETACNKWC